MGSHRNRSNRRSGGDRKFVIRIPELTEEQRLMKAIDNKIAKHPDWQLKQIADWAYKYAGAPMDMVVKVLENYCAEEE